MKTELRKKLFWYIVIKADNGEVLFTSETYYSKSNAVRAHKAFELELLRVQKDAVDWDARMRDRNITQDKLNQAADEEDTSYPFYRHRNSRGVLYYLNAKEVTLRAGKKQMIYYFSRDKRPEAVDLPSNLTVRENPRNGFLTVQRVREEHDAGHIG